MSSAVDVKSQTRGPFSPTIRKSRLSAGAQRWEQRGIVSLFRQSLTAFAHSGWVVLTILLGRLLLLPSDAQLLSDPAPDPLLPMMSIGLPGFVPDQSLSLPLPGAATELREDSSFHAFQLYFERNEGQSDSEVKFLVRGS